MDEVIQQLERRQTSSLELVEGAIARITALDGGANGLRGVISLSSRAHTAAAESDARRKAGRALSVLDGVPILMKDCIETIDAPTTHGSALFREWTPARDAGSVRIMREAGAIVVGKASLDDFAAATVGISSLNGTMRHPSDPSLTVGGSSGGSALGVAAGYVPLALGTDTGGSLRIPAAACGVVALRPTPGVIPTDGVFPRSLGQDVVGPIADTVLDVAIAFDLFDRKVRDVSHRTTTNWSRKQPATAIRGLTVGLVRTGLAAWGDDPDGPVVALVERVADLLADSGANIVNMAAPPRELLSSSALVTAESAMAVDRYLAERPTAPVRSFAELNASQSFTEAVAVAFEREYALSRDERRRQKFRTDVLSQRASLSRWTREAWEEHQLDVVIYPTAQRVAGVVGTEQQGIYTRWAEHAGLPALALPSGSVCADSGMWLPASVEVVARPRQEATLLAVGAAIEALVGGADVPGQLDS